MEPAVLLSKALSYAIVCGSGILKLPQIFNIVKAKSAEGVSLPAHQIECISSAIAVSWGIARGLDFKDYGESVIISVQLVVLVLLIGFYSGKLAQAFPILVATAAVGTALAIGAVPAAAHEALLGFQIVFVVFSRVPQIYLNYKKKQTGQLAFLTYFLAGGGAGARVFTTFMNVSWEKGKALLLAQFLLVAFLNLLIVFQIFLYRGRKSVGGEKSARPSVAGDDSAVSARPSSRPSAAPRKRAEKVE